MPGLGALPAGLYQASGSALPGTHLENPAERPQRACACRGEWMACGSGRTRAGVFLGARGLWFVRQGRPPPWAPSYQPAAPAGSQR